MKAEERRMVKKKRGKPDVVPSADISMSESASASLQSLEIERKVGGNST